MWFRTRDIGAQRPGTNTRSASRPDAWWKQKKHRLIFRRPDTLWEKNQRIIINISHSVQFPIQLIPCHAVQHIRQHVCVHERSDASAAHPSTRIYIYIYAEKGTCYVLDLRFRYLTCVAVAGIVYRPSNPRASIIYTDITVPSITVPLVTMSSVSMPPDPMPLVTMHMCGLHGVRMGSVLPDGVQDRMASRGSSGMNT